MNNKKQKHEYSNIDASESPEHWVQLMAEFNKLSDIQFMRKLTQNWIKDIKPALILDAGCGTGDSTRQLADTLPKSTKFIGIDFSEAMIEYCLAQDNPDNVQFQKGDIVQLNFSNDSFDVVRIERVLHHIENLHTAFKELYRVLKPGKTLIISEPDVNMLRLFPLELELNHEFAKRLCKTMANADVGYQLPQLASSHGFIVKEHKIIHLIWNDFEAIDSKTHFINTLRDVLAEHKKMHYINDIIQAAKEGKFYLAIPIHSFLLEKS